MGQQFLFHSLNGLFAIAKERKIPQPRDLGIRAQIYQV